jgi:four helix bundle protein
MAWQKSMDFVVEVYRTTGKFPPEELYGLTAQLRRAAVSAPSNIAEGAANRTQQQFSNYLSNAMGPLNEADTQLALALRLGYVTRGDYNRLCRQLDECIALSYGLRKSLGRQ